MSINFGEVIDWIILNSPFICALVVLIRLSVRGYKEGFVAELCNFISAIIASIAILLLAIAIKGVFDQEKLRFVVAIILIILLAIIHKLVDLIFDSLKLVSKIPGVNFINRMCGVLMAVCETIVIVWAVYCVVIIVDGGLFGRWILNCVKANPLMRTIYEYNYLYKLVYLISDKVKGIDLMGILGL